MRNEEFDIPRMLRPHFTFHHVLGWSFAGGLILLLVAALGVGAITYDRAYADRVFPGVRIGPIDVGGLTKSEALARVEAHVDVYLDRGIPFTVNGRTATVQAIVGGARADVTYALIDIDEVRLVEAAFAVGRRGAVAASWDERVRGAMGDDRTIPIRATIDREQLTRAIHDAFGAAFRPMEPPKIRAATAANGTTYWEVIDGLSGTMIDHTALDAALATRIALLDTTTVAIATVPEAPPYTRAQIEAQLPAFDLALSRAPIALTHERARWTIDASMLAGWLRVNDAAQPALDRDRIDVYLAPIKIAIERTPEDGRFAIDPATKRVREFRTARDGVRIDTDALTEAIEAAVFGTKPPVITIPTAIEQPAVTLGSTNDLGIRELLGIGRTSFAGSPANRRHNIRVGSELLNGLLIPPGTTFSTVGAVSPITAAKGYKPELVIKEGRTVPEFGGGLCQVSTTLFRAVLASGLPVVERSNHAYRVPYYEPPVGMDATIYSPKPDFTFTNDTGYHILIRTRIEGDTLVYEFWGSSDGRVATMSEPEVFNFVKPPPTRIIETDTLKPGEQQCTERAHTGADAKFTYTVTAKDGTVAERVFRSHYRPWQAVCLVGKSAAPAVSEVSDDATPTPAPELVPVSPSAPDILTIGGIE